MLIVGGIQMMLSKVC